MEYQTKTLLVEVKADGEDGVVSANFAKFDDKDRDGEITRKGAFGNQKVLLGAYGHNSWGRSGNPEPPIGIGTIKEIGPNAVFEGQFNLKMLAGRETYESVKMAGDLQEWSYGFKVDKESIEKSSDGPIRILEKLTVKEVAPVIVGAANASVTTGIKSGDMTLAQQTDYALTAWSDYIERVKGLQDLLTKEGRTLSTANRARLVLLQSSLLELGVDITDLLDTTAPTGGTGGDDEAEKAAFNIVADFERINTGIITIGAR